MKNPLSGIYLVIYVLFWMVVIAGHTMLLVEVNQFSLKPSLIDTITLYPLLAGFGMSYFYVVNYLSPDARIGIQETAIHFAGVLVFVTAITFGHDQIIARIISQPDYEAYLHFSVWWRIAAGMLLIFLLIVAYYLAIHNRLMKQEVSKQDSLKELLRQTEMEMLRFQINPHFIFNSLNSISALTMTAPEKAQDMVIKLSEFFRIALGTGHKDIHTVRDELRQADLYLDIERIRFGDRLVLTRKVDEGCLNSTLPAMILQPLFENAIKHGVYENIDSVEISVSIKCTEGSLQVTVANTYDPLQNGKGNGAGIGLKNVRSRLELMYGIPDLVTIERTNKNYKVHLLIPQL